MRDCLNCILSRMSSDKAEEILLSAVDKYSDSVDVYKACFKFYEDTKNQGEIPLILDGAKSSVADQLTEYASDSPEFSLDDSESFDDVQQLSLTTTEKNIYYTDDGSDPFSSKTRIKYENQFRSLRVRQKSKQYLSMRTAFQVLP